VVKTPACKTAPVIRTRLRHPPAPQTDPATGQTRSHGRYPRDQVPGTRAASYRDRRVSPVPPLVLGIIDIFP
jgi:hypothetical protein